MTRSPKRRYHKGPLGRAVIAGVLAAVGVTLGICVDDLTYTGHKSGAFAASTTSEGSTNVRRETE